MASEGYYYHYLCVCVIVAQSCPTLCDPMDYSPSGYSAMGFPRQEYLSGFPFPSPGDLPDPGINPRSPALQADSFLSEPPEEPFIKHYDKIPL